MVPSDKVQHAGISVTFRQMGNSQVLASKEGELRESQPAELNGMQRHAALATTDSRHRRQQLASSYATYNAK